MRVPKGPSVITVDDAGARIELSGGEVAVCDAADVDVLVGLRWSLRHPGGRGMVAAAGNGTTVVARRLIMRPEPPMLVHQRDGDPLNLRRSNLELVTLTQVRRMQAPPPLRLGRTGFRGVCLDQGLWRAAITVHGVRYQSRRYRTPEEAAADFDEMALAARGDAAVTNRSLGLL
jgi:hypothetical protein